MMRKFLIGALAGVTLTSGPALAWEFRQGNGMAQATQQDGRYMVMLRCNRGQNLELSISDSQRRGDEFRGVSSLMVWIQMPDGRTDRVSISPVYQEGGVLSGQFIPNGVTMDFFRNGTKFEVDSPQTRTMFISTDMRGTGAARLAILEQCGI